MTVSINLQFIWENEVDKDGKGGLNMNLIESDPFDYVLDEGYEIITANCDKCFFAREPYYLNKKLFGSMEQTIRIPPENLN